MYWFVLACAVRWRPTPIPLLCVHGRPSSQWSSSPCQRVQRALLTLEQGLMRPGNMLDTLSRAAQPRIHAGGGGGRVRDPSWRAVRCGGQTSHLRTKWFRTNNSRQRRDTTNVTALVTGKSHAIYRLVGRSGRLGVDQQNWLKPNVASCRVREVRFPPAARIWLRLRAQVLYHRRQEGAW